ncbi:MAG: hypothetical protein IJZ89_01405 [Clostridia bacterium]|nr:hypothetical protein [Clostridia bacterium]
MTHIITLSLLIIAVIVIRALFRGSVSPKMIYALWLVVLLKLCMPFSIFDMEMPELSKPQQGQIEETQTAIESSVLPYEEDTVTKNNYSTDLPDTAVGNTTEITPAETGIPEIGENAGLVSPGITPDKNDSTNKSDGDFSSPSNDGENILSGAEVRKISIASVLKSVWLCGSAVFALWFAFTNVVFSLSVRRDRRKVGKYKGLKVYVSEKVGTPCLRGIIPSVYLTPKAFDCGGRRLILAHEYTHLCHGDNIWSFFRIAAIVLLWWNPLIWIAAVLSKQDAELACDYALTKKMNDAGRINYARVIIDMLPVKRSLANGFANGSVKERIIMISKKHKTRLLSAILSVILIISAAGCSFVGISVKEDTDDKENILNSGLDTQAETDELNESDKPVTPDVPDETYFKVVSNDAGFEIKQIVFENGSDAYHPIKLDEKLYLCMVDQRKSRGEVDLHVVDPVKGEHLASLSLKSEKFPSQVMYTDEGIILYNFYYDTEKQQPIIECAFDVKYQNGELTCIPKTDFDLFPHYSEYIKSPDGSVTVYRTLDDVNGHGGIDIVYSDGRSDRISENIMLDDDIGGKKAGLGDVKGYSLIAFLDDNRFVYRIGGWEWTWGYGIYDISTGEKTEYLDGLGLQAIDEDGNFYVSEVVSYEPQSYYKITPEGESILIASNDENPPEGVIKLVGHSNRSVGFIDNYGSIHEFTEDGTHTYTITTLDFKTQLCKYEMDHSFGTTFTFLRDGTLTFVTFGNQVDADAEISSTLAEMKKYDDSIELVHMSEDVDFSYLEIDFEGGANGSGRMSYRIDNSHYLHMVYALGSTNNLNFYLVDIMSGVLKDSCSAECDTLPHIESYTDDGIILSGWRKNDSGESYIDAVYKLSFEDSKIHLETIGSGEYATDKKIKIVSPDGKTIVYLVEVDELLQGYVEAVHPDSGERERIFENVFSEEYPRLGSSGQGADRYDILRYTPIGFISNDVFAYHIGGVNWSEGYGTYNVKTGDKVEYLDGMRLRYVCGDKMYLFTFDDKDIYETDISGKRRLIASENAPEGVFNLAEGKHGTVDKVSFSGDAFIVEYKDYSSHIYKTAYYSPDFSEELILIQYKVSFLNSTDPIYFFGNKLTFVKFEER